MRLHLPQPPPAPGAGLLPPRPKSERRPLLAVNVPRNGQQRLMARDPELAEAFQHTVREVIQRARELVKDSAEFVEASQRLRARQTTSCAAAPSRKTRPPKRPPPRR